MFLEMEVVGHREAATDVCEYQKLLAKKRLKVAFLGCGYFALTLHLLLLLRCELQERNLCLVALFGV